MQINIQRQETPTGGPERTRRETIVPLNTGGDEVEPELYLDSSESTGWPWPHDQNTSTWPIIAEATGQLIIPFEQLDSQAASEQAGGSDEEGGVYAYGFSNRFQPFGDPKDPDDGDLNSSNITRKMGQYVSNWFDSAGMPRGGTQILSAVKAADLRFCGPKGEFTSRAVEDRPVRARVVLTDGQLMDEGDFRTYLSAAKPHVDAAGQATGYGDHGDWREVWAIGIVGPEDGGGSEALAQYRAIAKDHPWVHAYYFQNVVNAAEIAEDMAIAVVPTNVPD